MKETSSLNLQFIESKFYYIGLHCILSILDSVLDSCADKFSFVRMTLATCSACGKFTLDY